MIDFLANWIANSLGMAVPYALAALGLIIGERAGVLSLTAEGLMLVGALAGAAASLVFGDYPIPALLIAMLCASIMSLLFGFLVIALRVNQVIAGLAIVFFCQGLTDLVGTMANWTNRTIGGLAKLPIWPLSEIPVLGHIFFKQDIVIYLTVPLFLLVQFMMMRTHFGLRLRSVGENPEAADAAGINVPFYRFLAVVSGSGLIGLAGAYLSVGSVRMWVQDMAGGRGWIAIALVIFARWRPWWALCGALLFGGVEALVPRIAATGVRLPQYFMLMTPYIATLGVMIWVALDKRTTSDEPAALGLPHVREERR
jgi:general nucleoside transport system permease protein